MLHCTFLVQCLLLLTEEIKSHVAVGLLFGFFLSGRRGFGLLLSGGNWCGACESRWIGEVGLGLLGSGKRDVRSGGDGDEFLESVGHRVGRRCDGWVADVERNGGDVVNAGHKSSADIVLGDVEHGWLEYGALVVALDGLQTVAERRDLQHVQKGGFGGTDLVAWLEQMHGRDDFNGTSGNFGLDTQGLEETGLLRSHTGVLCWDDDVDRRDGASSSGRGYFVLEHDVSDLVQIVVGEHESDVGYQKWHNFFVLWEFVEKAFDALLHHSVLAHDDGGLSTEGGSNLCELQRTDVVGIYHQELGVVSDGILELLEVVSLPLGTRGESFGFRHVGSTFLRLV